jgi:hypothetical protein
MLGPHCEWRRLFPGSRRAGVEDRAAEPDDLHLGVGNADSHLLCLVAEGAAQRDERSLSWRWNTN